MGEARVIYEKGNRFVDKTGRHKIRLGKVIYPLARIVWNYTHPDDQAKEGEDVHHIDFNRDNNHPSNLIKLTREQHEALHDEASRIKFEQFLTESLVTRVNCLVQEGHSNKFIATAVRQEFNVDCIGIKTIKNIKKGNHYVGNQNAG